MAEMEKEGRPPEHNNKRSRKPAHPVKREINEEMKRASMLLAPRQPSPPLKLLARLSPTKQQPSPANLNFAESTMNELLGWYGYDKVELKDGEDIEIRNYPADGESRQHISVLKENSLPKSKLPEDSVISPYNTNISYSGLATGNGLADLPAGSKDHGSMPIVVPLIPPPFLKPPAELSKLPEELALFFKMIPDLPRFQRRAQDNLGSSISKDDFKNTLKHMNTEDDVSNVQIMCAWCQKVGIKRYSLSMGSEVKSFCSEKCFAACRRAYFKRNKARDEDGHAEHFPQQHYAKETPRLAFKNNCELLLPPSFAPGCTPGRSLRITSLLTLHYKRWYRWRRGWDPLHHSTEFKIGWLTNALLTASPGLEPRASLSANECVTCNSTEKLKALGMNREVFSAIQERHVNAKDAIYMYKKKVASIYMGRPTYGTNRHRDYYDRGYDRGGYDDREYYSSRSSYRGGGGGWRGGQDRDQYSSRRRSPSPYYSRCGYRSRSRSRSYSPHMGTKEQAEKKDFVQDHRFVVNQKVCDWCKHIRHTKEYLDFGDGERRLQFCSAKCLNQYKMDIFYKEAQANLPAGLCGPVHPPVENKAEGTGLQLLTPDSWNIPLADARRKVPSPLSAAGQNYGPGLSMSTNASPSDVANSSVTKIPTPVPKSIPINDSPNVPPSASIVPPMGVPPRSPPMVMTNRGPVPLPIFMEQQIMQQIRPPFMRGPHCSNPNSPLPNSMIPGIGPPQGGPRGMGPASSPMHRSMLSPHIHPPTTPTMPGNHPGLLQHPPGPPLHSLPFPPIGMMPNGPMHMPQMMNFGMASLAPLVPPPTLLVPYPVIVPLPVPIPIPIPIPHLFDSKPPNGFSSNGNNIIPSTSSDAAGMKPTHNSPPQRDSNQGSSKPSESSSSCSGPPTDTQPTPREQSKSEVVDLTIRPCTPMNRTFNIASVVHAPQEGVIDLTLSHRSRSHNVIHRALHAQVKVECEPSSVVDLALNSSDKRNCSDCRDNCSPTETKTLPCSEPGNCSPVSHTSSAKGLETSSAVCNVIVNGTKCTEGSKNSEQSHEQKKTQLQEEPVVSELESVKENNCTVNCHLEVDTSRKTNGEEALTDVDLDDPNLNNPADEDHAYALRMLPKAGCVIQPVPKPAEKTVITPCIPPTPILSTGPEDVDPPLKRRCLRIRNQNK